MKFNFFIVSVVACLLTGCTEPIPERQELQDKQLSCFLDDRNSLIKMAEKKFGKLTEADEILFAAVADGNWADYTEGEGRDKTEEANNWGAGRIINASRIEWLCHDKQAKEIVTDKGIRVKGAKIVRAVDLDYAEVAFPLTFWGCVFEEEINMNSARIKFLILTASHTGSIWADGVKVEGGVFLRDGFKANGEVSFLGADIGEDFDCTKGEFINEGGRAISAERMDVKGTVFLKNSFKANREVSFLGATIGGDFDCTKGEFINEGGRAIIADRMKLKGNVFLGNGFRANGEVRFPGAMIDGDFVCENGEFISKDKIAISADGMDIKGSVYLRGEFKANGEVRFPGAVIIKDFYCTNGEFINEDGKAIFADGMNIKGCVYFEDGFKSNGEIRLLGATIGGDLVCENGEFINKGDSAIKANGMDVKGSVILGNGFKAEGQVSFIGSTVDMYLIWSGVNLTEKTILDLRNAKTGILLDDKKSWPAKGNLFLDGFTYENIGDYSPKDAKSRIEWLNRQGDEQFRPGPYEQLAKVLEKMGHHEDAIKIHIEKEKKITKHGGFGWWGRFWRVVLYWTIGYGYRSWWALYWMGGFVLFGFGLFGIGYITGVIVPMEKDEQIGRLRKGYSKFSILGALVYSIELFVPVVDLRMAKFWIPDANKWWGDVIRWYMWVHISAGWILTTLLIVGLTGLIKN